MRSKELQALIDSCKTQPNTKGPIEAMYCLMKEAKAQPKTEAGKFRAMDLHNGILDLADEQPGMGYQVMGMGMREDIAENQERLGIA